MSKDTKQPTTTRWIVGRRQLAVYPMLNLWHQVVMRIWAFVSHTVSESEIALHCTLKLFRVALSRPVEDCKTTTIYTVYILETENRKWSGEKVRFEAVRKTSGVGVSEVTSAGLKRQTVPDLEAASSHRKRTITDGRQLCTSDHHQVRQCTSPWNHCGRAYSTALTFEDFYGCSASSSVLYLHVVLPFPSLLLLPAFVYS